MLKLLQPAASAVMTKVYRHPWYYGKYNNTLMYTLNRRYTQYADECRASYAKDNPTANFPPSPLFTDAVTLIKRAFPREKAVAYSEKISALIDADDTSVLRPHELQIRIKDPLRTLGSDMLDVFKHPEVNAALMAFFRCHFRIEWVNVFRSVPATHKISSWLWHCDSFPPGTCKLFLHFTPATADLGATEFMNREDTMAIRRAGYFGQYLGERYADLEAFAREHGIPYRPYRREAEPGDATIFDMNFFHRAVSPTHDFRDVMQVFLLPNPIPWNEQLAKDGIDSYTPEKGYPKDPRWRLK